MRTLRYESMMESEAPAAEESSTTLGRLQGGFMALDARSLSLVRICLSLCMLADLSHSILDYSSLFSDSGVMPRLALHGLWRPTVENSLYLMSGLDVVNYALLALQAVATVSLLIGYRTRISVAVCLIFTISLQSRNFITNQGSDDLMRLLLFAGLFVPMGARWSVDAALNQKRVPDRLWSIGAVAIQVQAMCVYTFGALLKFEGTTWLPGHAVALALSDGTYGGAIGRLFLPYPELLHYVTYGVEFLELLMPLLIWFPIANKSVRTVGLIAVIMMHLSFIAFLHVGLFPYVSITSLLLFVTASHWQFLQRLWQVPVRCTRLYYDQDCGFCYKTCRILRSFCLREDVSIARAQLHPEAGPLLAQYNSWVVYDETGRHYLGWEAVCFVLMQSPVFWIIGRIGKTRLMMPLGTVVYKTIGRNRGALGQITGRHLPFRNDDGHAGLISELLASGFMAIMLLYNVAVLRDGAAIVPQWVQNFAIDTRLEQKWTMFAPDPRAVTDWAVARAVTANGGLVNIFGGQRSEYSERSPENGQVTYPDSKWKKYYEALFQAGYASLRPYYGQWMCRSVNNGVAPGNRVVSFTMILFTETPFAPVPGPRTTQVLWSQACPD
jgi:predicted DCC family thiol-disulfide oxidoreductase YuxK